MRSWALTITTLLILASASSIGGLAVSAAGIGKLALYMTSVLLVARAIEAAFRERSSVTR